MVSSIKGRHLQCVAIVAYVLTMMYVAWEMVK